mgnify:CR=1 FL=1
MELRRKKTGYNEGSIVEPNATQVWFTIREAANYLRVSTKTLRRGIKDGKLKSAKPTGKYLFRKIWLDAWAFEFGVKLTPTQRRTLQSEN